MDKLIIASLNNAKSMETVDCILYNGKSAYGHLAWWPSIRKAAARVKRLLRANHLRMVK
jgi:hypothetical protein